MTAMSDFMAFSQLGFRHIASIDAVDHLLFLVALAALHSVRDWRAVLWAASAFTVGHSVTLALAVTDLLVLPSAVIEFLIPVTIVLTAAANLVALRQKGARRPPVLLMGVFGLVHGAGFANYLRSLFMDSITMPLIGFNVGIEIGQLCVLALVFAGFALLDRLGRAVTQRGGQTVMRLRAAAISAIVAIISGAWALQRSPW